MTAINPENNPLGILGIDHLEFTCDQVSGPTRNLFYKLGFSKKSENKEFGEELFSQGKINFLLKANKDSNCHSRKYFEGHGEGVSKMSFEVENAEHAFNEALNRGATEVVSLKTVETDHGVYKTAAIQGFGDVLNEFVERPQGVFRPGHVNLDNDGDATLLPQRLARIDHLTNNVPKGEMDKWTEFYKNIYGFKETRYFDIKGVKTGLLSRVVQLENNSVIIPINEPEVEDGKSQIQEFLDLHKGAGVQHIAFHTGYIIEIIQELQNRGIEFLNIPGTYYEDIPKRNFTVTEDLKVLEDRQILVDGDPEGYLLQIFSQTYIGPLFFEFIQRKGHMGFGEGNFQALFDAIERDQEKRGYLS